MSIHLPAGAVDVVEVQSRGPEVPQCRRVHLSVETGGSVERDVVVDELPVEHVARRRVVGSFGALVVTDVHRAAGGAQQLQKLRFVARRRQEVEQLPEPAVSGRGRPGRRLRHPPL